MAPVRLLHEPQRHREHVPGVRDHRRPDRRGDVDCDPLRVDGTGNSALRPSHLQRVRYCARPHHDLLHGDAGDDRRLRQLDRAADDRGARHGVPAPQQHFVLAVAGVVHAVANVAVLRRRAGWQRSGRRLDAVRTALDLGSSRSGGRFRDPVAASCGRVVDSELDQLHHHHLQHARARHDAAQDAAVRLVDPGDDVPSAACVAGAGGRHHHASDRP